MPLNLEGETTENTVKETADKVYQELKESQDLKNSIKGQLETIGFEEPENLAEAQKDMVANGSKHCVLSRASEGIQGQRLEGLVEDCKREIKQFADEEINRLWETARGNVIEEEEEQPQPQQQPQIPQELAGMIPQKKDSKDELLSLVRKNQ